MIELEVAMKLAKEKLRELEEESEIELALLLDDVFEFDYGWLFGYQSKSFVESGDLDTLVGGNAPIIVDKYNSTVHLTGTRRESDFYIKAYCLYRYDIQLFKEGIS